jgi:hypothetical protein
MSQNTIISYDLRSALRINKVTIRQFAASVGLTLIRVREIANKRKCALADADIFSEHIKRLGCR